MIADRRLSCEQNGRGGSLNGKAKQAPAGIGDRPEASGLLAG